jgi:type III restriction enzyme
MDAQATYTGRREETVPFFAVAGAVKGSTGGVGDNEVVGVPPGFGSETLDRLSNTVRRPALKLGRQIAADPETELRRVRVLARILTGRDGLRRTELVTGSTADHLEASNALCPLIELHKNLVDALLTAPIVPKRRDQLHPANRIVETVMEGIGADADKVLSAYGDRAAARLVRLVTDEHRRFLAAPQFEHVVEMTPIHHVRQSKRKVLLDRTGKFIKSAAYDSFDRSLYGVDWFDSEPERRVANIADGSKDVTCWVRLQVGEMAILWRSDGRVYNADVIVVEAGGKHWVVEIKADDSAGNFDVQSKRTAAQRWVNHVNASDLVHAEWHYLLATETDIAQAQGSWAALKNLGS